MRFFSALKKKVVQEKVLSGYEVLSRAFCKLVKESVETVVFEKPVDAVIAAQGDPHRGTRYGYMTYDEAHVLRFGGKVWAIALGRKTGYHPGSRYTAEIAAVKLTGVSQDEFVDQLQVMLERSHNERIFQATCDIEYFFNTLVLSTRNGELEGPDAWRTRFGGRYQSDFASKLKEATWLESYHDSGSSMRSSGTRYRVTGYKPEAVDLLLAFIREALSK